MCFLQNKLVYIRYISVFLVLFNTFAKKSEVLPILMHVKVIFRRRVHIGAMVNYGTNFTKFGI